MTLSYNTVIMKPGQPYTLAELADASAAALDVLGVEARNGQVRERPDTRTIRYYGTLGLVDRPAAMSGRTALYGDRHLLQVLAVKALQARGASLTDVQRNLVGASDAELRSAIGPGLPDALAAAGPAVDGPRAGAGAFWQAPPAPPAVAAAKRRGDRVSRAPESTVPAALQARRVIAVPLAAGVTLMIDSDNGHIVDVAAVRAAAGPLLTYMTGAGLLPAPPSHPGADQ